MLQEQAGIEQAADFVWRQDLGEFGCGLAGRDAAAGSGLMQRDVVQEAQRAGSLVGTAPGQLALFDQVQQVALDLILAQVRRGLVIILGELLDHAQIGLLGPLGQTAQLHVGCHLLT